MKCFTAQQPWRLGPEVDFFFDALIRTVKKCNKKKMGDFLQFYVGTYWYALSENWS